MAPQQNRHDCSVTYTGPRNDIDLEVISEDPTSNQIEVQCTVVGCERRFTIGKGSLANQRMLARKAHWVQQPPSATTPSWTTVAEWCRRCDQSEDVPPYTVVPSTGEGRRYLSEWCKVDKVILSVQALVSSDVHLLYAKSFDQKMHLLGRALLQETGYPKVMDHATGSVTELDEALRKCQRHLKQMKAQQAHLGRLRRQVEKEWRDWREAFHLICDPRKCPSIEDCTPSNLDSCLSLLTDDIPEDTDHAILDQDGELVGHPPRPGTKIPSHYIFAPPSHQCIIDYHPPGCPDSPASLLPILVDIVAKDSLSHRKECVLQLKSGELVKVWLWIEADCPRMRKVFPQLDALLQRPVLSIPLYNDEPIPPPVRVQPAVAQVPMLTHGSPCLLLDYKDGDPGERPLSLFGLTAEETRMPPSTHDDSGQEQRLELKRDILQAKSEECLDLLAMVRPDDPILTPEARAECHARLEILEAHAAKLIGHINNLGLKAKPRKLPKFEAATLEQLQEFQTCNALHQNIVTMHARRADVGAAPNLDRMSMHQLEAHWDKITQ